MAVPFTESMVVPISNFMDYLIPVPISCSIFKITSNFMYLSRYLCLLNNGLYAESLLWKIFQDIEILLVKIGIPVFKLIIFDQLKLLKLVTLTQYLIAHIVMKILSSMSRERPKKYSLGYSSISP